MYIYIYIYASMWSWNLVNSPKQHNLQLCQIKNPFFVSPLPVTR